MKIYLILSGCLAATGISSSFAQNASYNSDNIPVNGTYNCAFGVNAMASNSTGSLNVAMGDSALYSNSIGLCNIAIGASALRKNTASGNTAVGFAALFANTSGIGNTGLGYRCLNRSTTGGSNTAVGLFSLREVTTSNNNTAVGWLSGTNITSGSYNTVVGAQALYNVITGTANVAMGNGALNGNITGNNNTALGFAADVTMSTLNNATALGNGAIVNASNKIRFGDANVTVVEGPVAYTFSDGRFKSDVSETDVKGLAFIKLLRPVVYNLETKKIQEFLTKHMPDSIRKLYFTQDFSASRAIRQSGFIAQEVEKAAEQVGYNFNGVHTPNDENDNYSVSYSQFVVPLVKAVQEQQQIIEQLQQKVDLLEKSQHSASGVTGLNTANTTNGFFMDQNIPNPFTGETVINYSLPNDITTAYLTVYDLSGKQISSFPLKHNSSSVTIASEKLLAGIYIYSIIADGKILDSKRMVVSDK